jgi:uncharacterized membrane protein
MNRLTCIAVLAFATGLAEPANASLQVCNQTNRAVRVAVGNFDGKVWGSAGWWSIASKQCAGIIGGPLVAEFYYLYAVDSYGGVWGGSTHFCTAPNSFTATRRDVCAAGGYDRRGFFEIDTGKSPEWTQTLSD